MSFARVAARTTGFQLEPDGTAKPPLSPPPSPARSTCAALLLAKQGQRDLIETRAILIDVGFSRVDDNTFKWDFGNGELTAMDALSFRHGHAIILSGLTVTTRAATQVDTAMPLRVETFEVGLAWLAYACRDCQPATSAPWLTRGLALNEHLPWEVKRRNYAARPQCAVAKDWFRVAAQELRTVAETAGPTDAVEIAFDGASLRIAYFDRALTWAASGKAWEAPVNARLADMRHLPKRLKGKEVYFDIWDGRIVIHAMRFDLIETATGAREVK